MPVCGRCIASQGLRAEPRGSSDRGLHRIAYGSSRSGLSIGLRNSRWDEDLLRVTSCCFTGTLISLVIVAGGYQDDCYKVRGSCILASVLDKGKLAAR